MDRSFVCEVNECLFNFGLLKFYKCFGFEEIGIVDYGDKVVIFFWCLLELVWFGVVE